MRKSCKVMCVVFTVVAVGCFRSPSARFYSLVSQERIATAQQLSPSGVELEVAPIIFPQYLDDPRMVVRFSGHGVERDEYDRWIEDLDLNFRRVLLSDISRYLKSSNVFSADVYAQRRGSHVVQIEVLQFDASEDGTAVLKARWLLGSSREALASSTMTISEYEAKAEGSSTEARVTALSSLIDRFSREVAQKVAG